MAIVLEEEGIEDRTEDRKNDDYPFIKKSATIPEEEDPWATEGD